MGNIREICAIRGYVPTALFRLKFSCCLIVVVLAFSTSVRGQEYSQRGFLETRGTLYTQKAINDPAQVVGDVLFRYESFFRPTPKIQINAAIDLRTDTHHQVDREFHLSWWDREQRRSLAEVRRLSAAYHNGGLSVELGKQFIRWGRADILNPTDRFAPRDYLTVVDNDFLGITAARAIYEKGSETLDIVWAPRLTPSRIPLPDQRWTVPPDVISTLPIRDVTQYPGGPQEGIRWSHVGAIEFSGSYYSGFNHLPTLQPVINTIAGPLPGVSPLPGDPQFLLSVDLLHSYPRLRMTGADVAVPLRWLTLKSEAGYFSSSDPRVDKYAQYVVQLERQTGEWTLVGGYAGEAVTEHGTQNSFAPDRGLTKTLLASAHYTIDANRNVAFETSVRQNLDGAWIRAEYSQAIGQHWRGTTSFSLIRGAASDFLGQYRHNSHAMLVLRYSF